MVEYAGLGLGMVDCGGVVRLSAIPVGAESGCCGGCGLGVYSDYYYVFGCGHLEGVDSWLM